MKTETELTEAGRDYAAAYAAHYTDHDLPKALQLPEGGVFASWREGSRLCQGTGPEHHQRHGFRTRNFWMPRRIWRSSTLGSAGTSLVTTALPIAEMHDSAIWRGLPGITTPGQVIENGVRV